MQNSPLTTDSIAEAGVRIADDQGLDAVTMRRVAGVLGVSAMALYRHVADRQALLLLMAEAATRDYALLPQGSHTWKQMVEHMADAQWRAFHAHPWLLRIVLTPRRLVNMATPAEVERLLFALGAAGLDEEQAIDCLLGISAAVIGTAAIASAARSAAKAGVAESAASSDWHSDALVPHSLAARFQRHGISDTGSRRSLDYLVATFIVGVEHQLTTRPAPNKDPVIGKEENETQQ